MLRIQPHCSNIMVLEPGQGYRGTTANEGEKRDFIVFSAYVLGRKCIVVLVDKFVSDFYELVYYLTIGSFVVIVMVIIAI